MTEQLIKADVIGLFKTIKLLNSVMNDAAEIGMTHVAVAREILPAYDKQMTRLVRLLNQAGYTTRYEDARLVISWSN